MQCLPHFCIFLQQLRLHQPRPIGGLLAIAELGAGHQSGADVGHVHQVGLLNIFPVRGAAVGEN